ncbi:MAG: cytochrome P450 [Acidimicrobiales bacterium]
MSFNPYSRSHLGDPHPVYAALREERPVHHNDRPPFWAVSRYADVEACLKDWRTFISGAGITLDGFTGVKPMIILMDPPRHDQLRRVLLHAFTPARVEASAERIRRITSRLLDDVEGHDHVDLVASFTAPLPMLVIAELLGVDPNDQPKFKEWSNGIMLTKAGDADSLFACYGAIFDYFAGTVAARRREPRDDLVSALVAAEVDGVRLDDDEILGFCALLLIAGNETTTNLLGNIAIVLDQHRSARAELLGDPDLVPAAVEEVLRYEGPVPTLTRTTTRDVELHGTTIPAGEKVLLLLAAANRDPRAFDHADRFDLHRTDNRHLAFGHGIHFCMGANLARLEARIATEELLRRCPDYAVAVDRIEYFNTPSIRGPVRLPVSTGRRPSAGVPAIDPATPHGTGP